MARRTFGPISDLFDLRGRRRALEALRRAFPELGEGQRRTLARQSLTRQRQGLKQQRRAVGQSPVSFCRRLTFEGWENLHNASDEALFLLAPLGSMAVATRVLELYHQGREHAAVIPALGNVEEADNVEEAGDVKLFSKPLACSTAPARRALATGTPAIWILAIPDGGKGWRICFQPPIPPFGDDTALSLTKRYLDVLDEAIRCHPESWPWRELG